MAIDGWLELVEVSAEKQAGRLKTRALLETSNGYHINLPRKLPWKEQRTGKINTAPHILQICRTRGGCGRGQGPQGAPSTTRSLLETEGSENLTLQLRTALPAWHLLLISYAFLLNFHPCIHVSWWFCSCLCISWGFEAIVCDSPPSSHLPFFSTLFSSSHKPPFLCPSFLLFSSPCILPFHFPLVTYLPHSIPTFPSLLIHNVDPRFNSSSTHPIFSILVTIWTKIWIYSIFFLVS